MSDTVSSQFDAKNRDDASSIAAGGERRAPWALAAQRAAVGAAMSGQLPVPPGGGYPTHHLPPTVPTPTSSHSQYPSAAQRLRLPPTLGAGPPPPAQGHLPPWGHAAAQATGLGSLPSGLHSYFGSPHLGGLSAPGRGAPHQSWQTTPKPAAHSHSHTHTGGVNPLFSLQMLVTPDMPGGAVPAPDVHAAQDYQQETMDLSSHSEQRRSPPKKDALRNGGIVSNGEVVPAMAGDIPASAASASTRPRSAAIDSVSVIAQNPLRESALTDATAPAASDKIMNCSSKNEVRSSDKAAEFSMSNDIREPHTDVDKASPLPAASPEPAASASPPAAAPQPIAPVAAPTEKPTPAPPPQSTTLINEHTPDNVESILENMFRIQDDKNLVAAATPPVTPHSVIVTNDVSRQSHDSSSSSTKDAEPLPALKSPEKINEQKLIEFLNVDEPDQCTDEQQSKRDQKVVRKEEQQQQLLKSDDDDDDEEEDSLKIVVPEGDNKTDSSLNDKIEAHPKDVEDKVKEVATTETTFSVEKETEPCIVIKSESEDDDDDEEEEEKGAKTADIAPVAASAQVKATTDVKVKDEPVEESDNMFTEVESELEKMFAGIVEPGSDGAGSPAAGVIKVEPSGTDEKKGQQQQQPQQEVRKRGRPKGALGAARRSSDTSYSGVDSSPRKKKAKVSEVSGSDKRASSSSSSSVTKKVRVMVTDFNRDSPSGVMMSSSTGNRKGRPPSQVGKADSGGGGGGGRGPVVHVQGARDNPTSVVVVNSGARGGGGNEEDDTSEKASAAKMPARKLRAIFHQEAKTRGGQGAGLYSSTLSLRYDSQTPDMTWLCVLCKRGPHYESSAGDLFGPYVVSLDRAALAAAAASDNCTPSDQELADEQKRRGGAGVNKQASIRATGAVDQFVQKVARRHKRTLSADADTAAAAEMSGLVPVAGEKDGYEVWVHEHCAVWAPGVLMIGARLIGLQDAVQAAIKSRCSHCGEPGACIGCITRGCPLLLHHGCARQAGWNLDEENFISKCKTHAMLGRR